MSVDVMTSQPMAPPVNQAMHSANQPLLIGKSPVIIEILQKADLVAKSQAPILITGESGTGKDIFAHLIHSKSDRRARELVATNCAALPKEVIDNELFGHEREAFTGAHSTKHGCFELADEGTLFLDEIAEMNPQSQAKLLRAIESQTFRRLGGSDDVRVNVRILAATNKTISAALESGAFREDLYYRLSVIEIDMPPLRDHLGDVPLLLNHFLRFFSQKYAVPEKTFDLDCIELLSEFQWPGNVRELRNVVERAVLICPHQEIGVKYLPERITLSKSISFTIPIQVGTTLERAEKEIILHTLRATSGNKAQAAKILGISRRALYNKLE